MSYIHNKRVELGPTAAGVSDVRIHQDRGNGTALCAIGTTYPDPTDWHQAPGRGVVDCQKCGESNTPEGRAAARKQARRDPVIAVSIDQRIARMKAKRSGGDAT